MTLITLLVLLALVCFTFNAFVNESRINLDAAGKAFLVGALLAYLQ